MRTGVLIAGYLACAFLSQTVPAEDAQPILQMGSQPSQVMAAKVTVSDFLRSYDFYTKVIGLKEVEVPGQPRAVLNDPEVAHTQAKLNFSGSRADAFLVLIKQQGVVPSPEQAKLITLVIKTADVRAAVNRVKAMGLPVQLEPQLYMAAVVSVVRDPDGYLVELFESPNFDPPAGE